MCKGFIVCMSTKHDDLMCSKKTLSDILLAIEKQGIFDLDCEFEKRFLTWLITKSTVCSTPLLATTQFKLSMKNVCII